MTLKELRKEKLSLKELQNLPLHDVYGYRKIYWDASDRGQWFLGTKQEFATEEYLKANTLIKNIERQFTVKQESKANRDLGYKNFNASYNELISTL